MSDESASTRLKAQRESGDKPPEDPAGDNGEPEDEGPPPDINYVEARDVTVAAVPGGTYRATIADDRSLLRVEFARAFPVSDANHYISIVASDGTNVGMMRDLKGMEPESVANVEILLEQKYFIPTIVEIFEIREEWGNQFWSARTNRGEVEFFVKSPRENLRALPPARLMMTDVDNTRFDIADIGQLDADSQMIVDRVI